LSPSAAAAGRAGAASRAPLRRALAAGANLASVAPSLDDETGRVLEVLAAYGAVAGGCRDLRGGTPAAQPVPARRRQYEPRQLTPLPFSDPRSGHRALGAR